MTTNLAPTDPDRKCQACGAAIWIARFGKDLRPVEPAPKQRGPFGNGRRLVGHVALSFPLPGSGGQLLGAIVRKLTNYRVHVHAAFSAGTTGQRKPRPDAGVR
jgi:hypothetical protein